MEAFFNTKKLEKKELIFSFAFNRNFNDFLMLDSI